MGLVFEEDRFVILTDILGMEDHLEIWISKLQEPEKE